MTQSLKHFGDPKKSIFYGTSIFESVTANNKYSHNNSLIGNLVTYHLVVISCKNLILRITRAILVMKG